MMRFLKVLSAVLVLGLGLAFGAPKAEAAACYGSSCAGRPPTICSSDAKTVAYGSLKLVDPRYVGFAGKYVYSPNYRGTTSRVAFELRYSPSCRANWARIYSIDRELYGELSVWNPGGTSRKTWIADGGAGTYFTPMVDGTKTACFGMQIYSGGRWRTWQTGYCA